MPDRAWCSALAPAPGAASSTSVTTSTAACAPPCPAATEAETDNDAMPVEHEWTLVEGNAKKKGDAGKADDAAGPLLTAASAASASLDHGAGEEMTAVTTLSADDENKGEVTATARSMEVDDSVRPPGSVTDVSGNPAVSLDSEDGANEVPADAPVRSESKV